MHYEIIYNVHHAYNCLHQWHGDNGHRLRNIHIEVQDDYCSQRRTFVTLRHIVDRKIDYNSVVVAPLIVQRRKYWIIEEDGRGVLVVAFFLCVSSFVVHQLKEEARLELFFVSPGLEQFKFKRLITLFILITLSIYQYAAKNFQIVHQFQKQKTPKPGKPTMAAITEDEEEREFLELHKRKFREFINPDEDSEITDRIQELKNDGRDRLIVNLDELRAHDNDLADGLLNNPLKYMRPLEEAVTEVAQNLDPDGNMDDDDDDGAVKKRRGQDDLKYKVGVEGSFGANHTTPRGLTSKLLSRMVCVEGIVTKVSVVRPKVMKSVHYCPNTNKHVKRVYRDATSLDGAATSSVYPTKDDQGNPLETEFGLCEYKDFQTIVIQEMPESAPLGQLPRSIEAMVEGDLVDKVKVGFNQKIKKFVI